MSEKQNIKTVDEKNNKGKFFEEDEPALTVYFDFLKKLINKVQIIKLKPLLTILMKKYNFCEDKCYEIVLEAQKSNYLLVSKDKYVMTLGFYVVAAEDKFYDATEMNNYLNHINFNFGPYVKERKGWFDCLTVVAEMMPISEHFFVPQDPWNFAFCTPEEFVGEEDGGGFELEPCLYEIIYIPKKTSTVLCQALANFKIEDPEIKNSVKRIAVLEDVNDAYKVPYVGFTNLININIRGTMKIVEQRENPWERN